MFSLNSLKEYYYVVLREKKIRDNERKRFLEEAKGRFENSAGQTIGSLKDYKKLLYKHRFSYDEYLRYKLYSLSQNERNNIISTCEMNSVYRKFVNDKIRKVFADKPSCLKLFDKWVQRRWCSARNSSFNDFVKLVSSTDCIIKPINGECGKGIIKVKKSDKIDYASLYDYCVNNDMLIEECIHACDEIDQFHPSSLNTIRVVTMSNSKKCVILGAALRMGIGGSVIDNIGGGGIFVPIDTVTGVIKNNAIDSKGNEYEKHPDTNKAIKGTILPYWRKVVEMCKDASKIVQGAVFIGWDICILPSGKVELIEANALPDIIAIQFVPGYEKRNLLKKTSNELLNINLLRLTSVWSRSYRKHD